MSDEVFQEAEEKMKKSLAALERDLGGVRAGRANPTLLDRVAVDYYGAPTPLNHLATISAPEARLLLIQPWDKSVMGDIEKAIMKSDLGLNPSSDGSVIRLAIPQLTQERREELTRVVRKKAEEARVAVRNIRREANERVKGMQKAGEISEDEQARREEKIQQLTDRYVARIDEILAGKEEEIMEV